MQQNIHGGDIYSRPVRLDFSVNGNPLGMPAEARLSLLAAIDHVAVSYTHLTLPTIYSV